MSEKKTRKMCHVCGCGMRYLQRVKSNAGVQAEWWRCGKCRFPYYCMVKKGTTARKEPSVQRHLDDL